MPGVKGKGGAKGRSGRKSKAEELGLKALLDGCVSEDDRKALFRSLLKKGKAGDVKAAGLLLGYIYGTPKQHVNVEGEATFRVVYADEVKKNGGGGT